jgi:hypothetical protein
MFRPNQAFNWHLDYHSLLSHLTNVPAVVRKLLFFRKKLVQGSCCKAEADNLSEFIQSEARSLPDPVLANQPLMQQEAKTSAPSQGKSLTAIQIMISSWNHYRKGRASCKKWSSVSRIGGGHKGLHKKTTIHEVSTSLQSNKSWQT